jgi:hypothetical protein
VKFKVGSGIFTSIVLVEFGIASLVARELTLGAGEQAATTAQQHNPAKIWNQLRRANLWIIKCAFSGILAKFLY